MPETTKYKIEGERLAEARAALRLTQQGLAEASGLTVSAVKAFERGARVPSRPSVAKLVDAGVNMKFVFSGNGPPIAGQKPLARSTMVNEGDSYADRTARAAQLLTLRETTQAIMQICTAMRYDPPALWLTLVQELMFGHGLDARGAKRIFETLRGQR